MTEKFKEIKVKTIRSKGGYFDDLKQIPMMSITVEIGALVEPYKITSSGDFNYIFSKVLAANRKIADHLLYESFYAFYLNRQNQLMGVALISIGSASACVVDIKKICTGIVAKNASGLIVGHTHPSGNATPSKQNKEITEKIKNAVAFFDCQLLDHVIYVPIIHEMDDKIFSFADEGLL